VRQPAGTAAAPCGGAQPTGGTAAAGKPTRTAAAACGGGNRG